MRKLKYFLGGRLFPCALLTLLAAAVFVFAAIHLPRALAPIALAERLFSLAVALFEVSSKDLPECKLPKLVLIVFLPWTGAVLCILWRRKPLRSPLPTASSAGEDRLSRIAALSASLCGLKAGNAESAEYFAVGREMYERLLADLNGAKKFIWLEYYIVARGAFFHAVQRILTEKAKAGVEIRLLYDDFGCVFTLPRSFEREMKRMGILAAPTRRITFPSRALNRRNHRKIAVIDGEIAYTGGINLADEYIGETVRFGHWKDTAIRITGSPAAAFAALFARDAELKFETESVSAQAGSGIPCAVVADSAEDTTARAGRETLLTLIGGAKRTLYLNTPYLAPDWAVLSALKCAARTGVDVRIMIPHIPDKKATFAISRSYARELICAGAQVREYTAGFLHAKSVVSDGTYSFVSTYNLDLRSLYLQAECGAVFKDETVASDLEKDFLAAWETGSPVKRAKFPERVLCALLRLFAPLV